VVQPKVPTDAAVTPAPAGTEGKLTFADPAGVFVAGTVLTVGNRLTTGSEGCFELSGSDAIIASVCASPQTHLTILETSDQRTLIQLEQGRLTTSFHHERAPTGHVFSIATTVASVSAVGTIFTVEVSAQGRVLTSVEEGVVEVIQGDGRVRVEAGEERVLHEPGAAQPRRDRTPGATTLQHRAQQARGAGEFRVAAGLYKQLVTSHPRSAEARVALVALGDLQLDKLGQPRAALRNYDRYVKAPGPLSEEAWHGRVRALAKMGRTGEEHIGIRAYLQRFPAGFYAESLRARLPLR
jgi:tetratricopeptide (TPR) repeat protein